MGGTEPVPSGLFIGQFANTASVPSVAHAKDCIRVRTHSLLIEPAAARAPNRREGLRLTFKNSCFLATLK